MNFFVDYFPDKLQAQVTELFNKAGVVSKGAAMRSASEVFAESQLRGYFMIYGDKADIKISFTLTPENPALVQEYRISMVNK